MTDETKDLTRQEQLEQWTEMVKACEFRPAEMSSMNDVNKTKFQKLSTITEKG